MTQTSASFSLHQTGVVNCQRKECDCSNPLVDTFCCPECAFSRGMCLHQETAVVYDDGQSWDHKCQRCTCVVSLYYKEL